MRRHNVYEKMYICDAAAAYVVVRDLCKKSLTLIDVHYVTCYATHCYAILTQLLMSAVPAHFIEKFSVLSTRHGDTSRLVCDAFGTRPLTVTWLKQTSNLDMVRIPLDLTISGIAPLSSFSQYTQPFSSSSRYLAFQKDYEDNDKKTVFELHILNRYLGPVIILIQ